MNVCSAVAVSCMPVSLLPVVHVLICGCACGSVGCMIVCMCRPWPLRWPVRLGLGLAWLRVGQGCLLCLRATVVGALATLACVV